MLMLFTTLERSLKRVKIATGRRFDEEDITTLFDQLKHIDDSTFREAMNDYMEETNPPRNMEGYVKKRSRELNWDRIKKQDPLKEKNWNNDEYAAQDQSLFFKCVSVAMEKYRFTGGYLTWVHWFNQKWGNLRGHELTEFMQSQYKALCNAGREVIAEE